MKKRLTHFSVHQTAKMMAMLYFVASAIICIPWGFYHLFRSEFPEGIVVFFFPFIYLLMSYVMTGIMTWFYNRIAGIFGGIEFTLTDPVSTIPT